MSEEEKKPPALPSSSGEHPEVRRYQDALDAGADLSSSLKRASERAGKEDEPTTLRPEDVVRELATPRSEHVLVVDDDPAIVAALVEILKDEGYSVRSASDGVEALDKILRTSVPPDLVLLDMGLPYLSGAGVLAALDTTRLSGLPVLFITAAAPHTCPPSVRRDQIYTKPINLDDLLTAVKRLIAEWRATPKLPF